jgi:protein gp37
MSKIEWTEETWNPLIGCSKISPGCKNCYAIQTAWIRQHNPKMAERYSGVVEKTPGGSLNWTGKVNFVNEAIEKPLRKKKPTMYFVNSMSDLFHEAVPFSVIHDIFNTIAACPQHTFQILTKRPARMLEYVKWFQRGGRYPFDFGPNVWMGVSVENQEAANERIPLLLQVPASVRFLSCEPLLGPVRLDQLSRVDDNMTWFDDCLTGFKAHGAGGWYDNKIDWVIVGGESGHGARPMHPDWARSLRDQCIKAGTSYFFKQWGAYTDVNNILPMPMGDFAKNVKSGKWVGVDKTGAVVSHVSGPNNAVLMAKVGKNEAGRQIDGREWNEFPSVKPVATEDPDLATGGFDY